MSEGRVPVCGSRMLIYALAPLLALSLAACGAGETRSADAVVVSDETMPIVNDRLSEDTTPRDDSLGRAFVRGAVRSVLLVGDSITDGYGCEGFGEHTDRVIYRGGEGVFFESSPSFGSWANDFRAWATQVGVPSDAFVNAGISGARMAWLADEPDSWLADADLIVVMLGTNDAVWSTSDEYEADARAALAAADAHCTWLVAVSPPDNVRADGRAQFGMVEADAVLTRVCEELGCLHVSALDAVSAGDGTLNEDGIHPTTAGSHAIWESLSAQLGLR